MTVEQEFGYWNINIVQSKIAEPDITKPVVGIPINLTFHTMSHDLFCNTIYV